MRGWTLETIDWQAFRPDLVDPDLLKVVKAAALVESNGYDYGTYLSRVFADDPEFCEKVLEWAGEEVKHGQALARWAQLADPDFDYESALKRFSDSFRIDVDSADSVRGSRTGEMVARCIVEAGTSSFYSAMADAAEEPVLKQIAREVAGDEFRHYKLFLDTQKSYADRENLPKWRRLAIALSRVRETEDDELASAYYVANMQGAYDRQAASKAYMNRAYDMYAKGHAERAGRMIAKASGLRGDGFGGRLTGAVVWGFVRARQSGKTHRRKPSGPDATGIGARAA